MKTTISCLVAFFLVATILCAKEEKYSPHIAINNKIKSRNFGSGTLHWQFNTVSIANGIATLNLPRDFKYLNREQSNYVLHDLWGNPPRTDVAGMIFPASGGPLDNDSYAFVITFDAIDYGKGTEEDRTDQSDGVKGLQRSEVKVNEEREKNGYAAFHLVGWPLKPYGDKENRVLYRARELKFGSDSINTLNYEIRIFGRSGILTLNAVATMNQLELVKANIGRISTIPQFTEGNSYTKLNSKTDNAAAYGIGALVLSGILSKTGILAITGEFLSAAWNFILLGIAGAYETIKKFFNGKPKKDGRRGSIEDDFRPFRQTG